MTTRVILSSSSWRDYSFLVPITALLWREVIGYEPFVFAVGDWTRSKRCIASKEYLERLGVRHVNLTALEGLNESSVAQNCRQHAAALREFQDDEWLMLSDADLWPLWKPFYHQHESSHARMALYYANGDHYQSYPTCHMTARASTWREMMGLQADDDLLGQLRRSYDEWLKPRIEGKGPSDAGWVEWNMDQWRTAEIIKRQSWFSTGTLMIERLGHPPVDRIDRGAWPKEPKVLGMVDAHLPKAPDQPGIWESVRPLLEQLVPDRLAEIDAYRLEYLAGY